MPVDYIEQMFNVDWVTMYMTCVDYPIHIVNDFNAMATSARVPVEDELDWVSPLRRPMPRVRGPCTDRIVKLNTGPRNNTHQRVFPSMDSVRKYELFDAARKRLGVKRLFFDNKEIILNGETRLDSPRKDAFLEVRDNDGTTVLARKSGEEFHVKDGFNYGTYYTACPDAFADDDDDDADEKEVPYCLFVSGECNMFEHMPPDDPFYTALGVPFMFECEGRYRGCCGKVFVHPRLVQQWRDLCHIEMAQAKLDTCWARVEACAGVNKRVRPSDA